MSYEDFLKRIEEIFSIEGIKAFGYEIELIVDTEIEEIVEQGEGDFHVAINYEGKTANIYGNVSQQVRYINEEEFEYTAVGYDGVDFEEENGNKTYYELNYMAD